MNQIETSHKVSESVLKDIASSATFPVVLKQQVLEWPSVQAAKKGFTHLKKYLLDFDRGQPLWVFEAKAKYLGRIFYNEDFSDVNFSRQQILFTDFLQRIENCIVTPQAPTIYMGSTNTLRGLPGFRENHNLDFGVADDHIVMNSWMGNQCQIAAHFDYPDNFACNISGTRTFTLFPPEQLENLYVGPLDFNPAGPAISLVDPAQPDFEQHPNYAEALQQACQATLEPGDVLFIPSMWWHQVSANNDFNMLVNFWWKKAAAYLPSPAQALNLAILTIKSLPKEQKSAWENLFRHYVFEETSFEHIPAKILGMLGDIDEHQARQLRAQLLNALNR